MQFLGGSHHDSRDILGPDGLSLTQPRVPRRKAFLESGSRFPDIDSVSRQACGHAQALEKTLGRPNSLLDGGIVIGGRHSPNSSGVLQKLGPFVPLLVTKQAGEYRCQRFRMR